MDKHAKDSKDYSQRHSSSSSQRSCSAPSSERKLPWSWRKEKDHRSSHHGGLSEQGGICLKEEMKKERMLITVSQGQTPPSLKVKQESKEQGRGKDKTDSGDKAPRNSREKCEKEKAESSDNSEDDKSPKAKTLKKKKKKKDKKKKKKD